MCPLHQSPVVACIPSLHMTLCDVTLGLGNLELLSQQSIGDYILSASSYRIPALELCGSLAAVPKCFHSALIPLSRLWNVLEDI